MHLELRPCPSSEFHRAAVVENRAFKGNKFSKILFPGPFPDNIFELRAQEIAKEIEVEPANRWFQVVDTEAENPNEGVAFAKWQIYTDKLPGPRQNRRFGKGCNVEACESLFGDLAKLRDKYVGDMHCICMFSFPMTGTLLHREHHINVTSSPANSRYRPDLCASRRRWSAPQMGH